MSDIVREALGYVIEGGVLNRERARRVMESIMDGEATPAQIGSLLTALRVRGETVEEITGFAEAMRAKAARLQNRGGALLDTCGTGGDGGKTFNISTAAAIIAAAGGVRVAKHGNRAMSSKSGSADVLEALGVTIQLEPEQAQACLEEVGICFMFAPVYHSSMKHAAGPRRELGFRTVFNLLGPLTNPASADRQLLGVYDRGKTEVLARVLKELGLKRALVVSSTDGLDEISISAPTQVTELKDGEVRTYEVEPEKFGLSRAPLGSIAGGDAAENAEIIRSILRGERGARRDVTLLNAGACFYLHGSCPTIEEGIALAAEMVDSGRALAKLEQLVQFTGELSHVS
jgi:anthranilate phosphoribosyltransferase